MYFSLNAKFFSHFCFGVPQQMKNDTKAKMPQNSPNPLARFYIKHKGFVSTSMMMVHARSATAATFQGRVHMKHGTLSAKQGYLPHKSIRAVSFKKKLKTHII